LVSFPNCKINLGLHISSKRADGYHNIETIFYPIHFKDVLEILPNQIGSNDVIFNSSGLIIDGEINNNLCLRAYQLLKKDFPFLPSIQMHLHKIIPLGAGLGGGSADAAFTLQILNKQFLLQLSNDKLINYAAQLGSDCPFFILNTPCFATGRGEILTPLNIDLLAYQMVIVNPLTHINTAWAFKQLTILSNQQSISQIIQQPIATWKTDLKNDFEDVVFQHYPIIKNIKETLYHAGAVYASISGTGSTVFGIFEKNTALPNFSQEKYFVKKISSLQAVV
jgi:4-diphosphocytidyl-2-C-methyl-D-erythritol kinase